MSVLDSRFKMAFACWACQDLWLQQHGARGALPAATIHAMLVIANSVIEQHNINCADLHFSSHYEVRTFETPAICQGLSIYRAVAFSC